MSIFGPKEDDSPKLIKITSKKNLLFLVHKNRTYSLPPSQFVRMNLSPDVMGMDEVIKEAMKIKGMQGDVGLRVEKDWFTKCDIVMKMIGESLDGWIYEIKEERIKLSGSKVWACSYLKMVMGEPLQTMFVSLEAI